MSTASRHAIDRGRQPTSIDVNYRLEKTKKVGVGCFPTRGYFILGRDGGGGAGGREKFRVVVAVVARPGPGSARPPFLFCLSYEGSCLCF